MDKYTQKNSANAPQWILSLPDADLRALAYLCGQVETYTDGALPVNAASISRAAQYEQTRRDVAKRVAAAGRTFISLMDELEHPMAYPMTPTEQLDEATGGRR